MEILPIELEISSLHIAVEARMSMCKSSLDCTLILECLNESRRLNLQHVETIQRRRKVAFDK